MVGKFLEVIGDYPMWVKVFSVIWLAVWMFVLVVNYPKRVESKADSATASTYVAGNQQNNQVHAKTVNIYQSSGPNDERDDLYFDIPHPMEAETADKLYSELLFNNRGTRDLTIDWLGCNAHEITTNGVQGRIISLWTRTDLEVLPARKTTTKKIDFQGSTMSQLRGNGFNKRYQVEFMCRLLNFDGMHHDIDYIIGELTITDNGQYKYIGLTPIKASYSPGSMSPDIVPALARP
jgi:hypothetical protein